MSPRRATPRTGFTLAEVAVTLVIVGIALVLILQGINSARFTAAHTHNRKVARQLALLTLGQIEAGLYWEDIDERLFGTYAEEGYPEWQWEVAVGEDALSDITEDEPTLQFDSWRQDEWEDDDEDEEESEQPFEKVRIRVVFPKLGELPNHVTLERWIPWSQVYGDESEDAPLEDPIEGEESA